jgi:hypothetical protein
MQSLARIEKGLIVATDKIDDVAAAFGDLKVAVDKEVADLAALRAEATTTGALNPDQIQRLSAIETNLKNATAELVSSDAGTPAAVATPASATPPDTGSASSPTSTPGGPANATDGSGTQASAPAPVDTGSIPTGPQ